MTLRRLLEGSVYDISRKVDTADCGSRSGDDSNGSSCISAHFALRNPLIFAV